MKFDYIHTSLLTSQDINKTVESLASYITHLNAVAKKNTYDDLESSFNLPFDEEIFNQVGEMCRRHVSSQLKYIIVIGIGGSNLGTKAIYDGLFGVYDLLEPQRMPKMIFLDTQDETILTKITALVNSLSHKEELLINVISKSGGTTETAANFEVLYGSLKNKFPEIHERIVFTTDEGSKMQIAGKAASIDVLTIPKLVGGRFSIFSAVGLFPLMALGVDIKALRRGAQNMRNVSLRAPSEDNPAATSAAILYLNSQKGFTINDNFMFLPQLESLGKWYRQLMGESIGKDGKGITPTVSIGSTDLHSVGQLYLGGPKNKITTFIYGAIPQQSVTVPHKDAFSFVDTIRGKSIYSIMKAVVEGTMASYQKQSLPYTALGFESVSAEAFGEFMQFKMMEMMYLGKLFNVNTFDQPHVELYKTEVKRLLMER